MIGKWKGKREKGGEIKQKGEGDGKKRKKENKYKYRLIQGKRKIKKGQKEKKYSLYILIVMLILKSDLCKSTFLVISLRHILRMLQRRRNNGTLSH